MAVLGENVILLVSLADSLGQFPASSSAGRACSFTGRDVTIYCTEAGGHEIFDNAEGI